MKTTTKPNLTIYHGVPHGSWDLFWKESKMIKWLVMKRFQVCILASLLSLNCWAEDKTVDLILVAGQSNAVGFDTRASELPEDPGDKNVMFWWRCGDPPADEFDSSCNQEWTTLKPQPKGKPKGGSYGNFKYDEGGFGPEIGFARTLLKRQPDRPLAIVKVAYSATGIYTWKPGNTMDAKRGANGYPALMSETKLAIEKAKAKGITLRPRAFVWVQGENDTMYGPNPERYRDQLEELITALRKDLDAPEMIALVGFNTKFNMKNSSSAKGPEGGNLKIAEAMKALAASSASIQYVDDWGCQLANAVHFSSKGTLELGERFANALIQTEARIKSSK